MKFKLFTFLILALSFTINSQEIEDNTLQGQFDKIYRKSTSYQTYKVISKEKYQLLKRNVLDSLKLKKNIITTKDAEIKKAHNNIISLETQIKETKQNLDSSIKKENNISVFGIDFKKSFYNVVLWSLILLLTFALLFFIYKFKNSNILTKEAKENLLEVEQELEAHRKKSLVKEQKLRRQLQDEINKQRS